MKPSLRRIKKRSSSGNVKEKESPENKYTPLRIPHLLQKNTAKMNSHNKIDENVRPAMNETDNTTHIKLSSQTNIQDSEDQDSAAKILQMCQLCREESSILLTKNECKNCGGIFCSTCSSNEIPLPSSINPERVCNLCHQRLIQQYCNSPS